MKKLLYLILVSILIFSCGPKQEQVERRIEDGVEVVFNHIEPYKIRGVPSDLILKEEFPIDTSLAETVKTGLFDINGFAVDSKGNIYCTCSKNPDNFIFKFDRNGRSVLSFGKKGRGPGEIERFASIAINSKDEIEIFQTMPRRLSFFNEDGSLLHESTINSLFSQVRTLKNGNYLVFGPIQEVDPSSETGVHAPLKLMDSKFVEIEELDIRKTPNPATAKRMKYSEHVFQYKISGGYIYVANEERDYEILVYNLDGSLVRKIKKEYTPVRIPEQVKLKFKEIMKRFEDRVYFADLLEPFQSIFTDDIGRLYVTSNESGPNPGELIHDIFSPQGIFIGRVSINHSSKNMFGRNFALHALIRNNRLYCLQENEDGYKKIAVFSMKWE